MQKSHKEHSKCKLIKPRVKIRSLSKYQQTTKEASLVHCHAQDSPSWHHSWVPATCQLHTHKYGRRISTTALCSQRLQTDSWEVSSSQTEWPDRAEAAQGNTERKPQERQCSASVVFCGNIKDYLILRHNPESPWGFPRQPSVLRLCGVSLPGAVIKYSDKNNL